jgi:hypothetical protein
MFTLKLRQDELAFLSAWAREEWEPECYRLPAHRLQLAHGLSGAQLILLIMAWTESEGRNDQHILHITPSDPRRWPWSTAEALQARLAEARQQRAQREERSKQAGAVEFERRP